MEGTYPGATYDPTVTQFWPKVFRANGYVTAQIGKWHTGVDTGYGRDWDYQAVWNRPGHPDNSTNYYEGQLISVNGSPSEKVAGYSTDNYTEWALEFIRGQHRSPGKPWYLWLCYSGPHEPHTPAARHTDAYPDSMVDPPVDTYPPRPGKPSYMQGTLHWVEGPDGQPRSKEPPPRSLTESVRRYNQVVLSIDEGVGRLIEALEQTGQRRNTLVVFASDQGFAMGQHGFTDKVAPYDANLLAPFIVSMPGTLPEGRVVDAPVNAAVDLPPTFFAWAGLPLPWPMHGHDLTPLLKNPVRAWNHPVLLSWTSGHFGSEAARIPASSNHLAHRPAGVFVPWWVSLRKGRFKYVRTMIANETEELYDLLADPQELENLASDPQHAARLGALRSATVAELRRTGGASMATRLPPVRVQGKSPR